MGQRHDGITAKLQRFIEAQHIFFVGTATADGRVNVSPKGMDSLRVLDAQRVVWLNVTGSGNETAAHVLVNPRMTLMFAALEGQPMILRLYGQARAIHTDEPGFAERYALFTPIPGARQIFELQVELVQTSCGMAVPRFDYVGEREQLNDWARNKGAAGIRRYWAEKNRESLDGRPTRARGEDA